MSPCFMPDEGERGGWVVAVVGRSRSSGGDEGGSFSAGGPGVQGRPSKPKIVGGGDGPDGPEQGEEI